MGVQAPKIQPKVSRNLLDFLSSSAGAPFVSGDGGEGLFLEIPPGSRSGVAGGRLGEMGGSPRVHGQTS